MNAIIVHVPCYRGGVYTPGVVFGNTKIVENLTDTGKVQFEVLEN